MTAPVSRTGATDRELSDALTLWYASRERQAQMELFSRLYDWLGRHSSEPGGDEWDHDHLRSAVALLLCDIPLALLAEQPGGEEQTPCTVLAASWCPVHGDCVCPRWERGELINHLNDPACPLHAPDSQHAEHLWDDDTDGWSCCGVYGIPYGIGCPVCSNPESVHTDEPYHPIDGCLDASCTKCAPLCVHSTCKFPGPHYAGSACPYAGQLPR